MGIFDKLKNNAGSMIGKAVSSLGNKSETFTFKALPESLAEMQALPEASLDSPFATAALAVCALCAYAADKQIGTEMLNFLRGPRPISNQEISFLNDRFRDGKTYVPFSYFEGATPDNNYEPSQPYTIKFFENLYARDNIDEGYLTLQVESGGADSPRQIRLRTKPSTGEWFLWEQFILADIRPPKSADPWA